MNFIANRDTEMKVQFIRLQSIEGRETLKFLGIEQMADNLESMVLAEYYNKKDRKYYLKSMAALRIFYQLEFPWPCTYYFSGIPIGLRDLIYDLVSKTRYIIFGKRGCNGKDICNVMN